MWIIVRININTHSYTYIVSVKDYESGLKITKLLNSNKTLDTEVFKLLYDPNVTSIEAANKLAC